LLRIPALVGIIALPPLLGAALAGEPIVPYLRFPPLTEPARAPGFHAGVFALLAAVSVLALAPLALRVMRAGRASRAAAPRATAPRSRLRLSWWGVGACAWVALAWALAWTRAPWFAPLQQHTFTPLWVGYVVLVNALAHARSGRCMLTHRTGRFLALFPLSAAFWWSFEYLNRFARNWHYEGIGDFGALEYTAYATLAFSTVLPAVLGTRDLLATWPRLAAGLGRAWRVPPAGRAAHATLLAGGALGLAGVAWLPAQLFPLLWVAPLLALVALDGLAGRPTLLDDVAAGDWRRVWLASLAALVCGFFWELWNFCSLARWEYTVPYVQRFHLFEMPLLGYAGYLPFGLTCVAAADFFLGRGALDGSQEGEETTTRTSA